MQVWLDVANIMGSRPDGWWRDRAGAAGRLLTDLAGCEATAADWRAGVGGAGPVTLVAVLEGAARTAADPPDRTVGGLPLLVRRAPGSGDDAIVTGCAAGDVVVTADRGLRARAVARGATVCGPNAVNRLLGR